jgi:repressor LexA
VDPQVFQPRADYLLRVRGMSMRDAGILDGDLLAVHRTPEARNGQVVVARLDDEVTVKRFQRSGDHVQLLPENPDFKPIEVNLRSQSLVIEGLGVGILRTGQSL